MARTKKDRGTHPAKNSAGHGVADNPALDRNAANAAIRGDLERSGHVVTVDETGEVVDYRKA